MTPFVAKLLFVAREALVILKKAETSTTGIANWYKRKLKQRMFINDLNARSDTMVMLSDYSSSDVWVENFSKCKFSGSDLIPYLGKTTGEYNQ